jgi:formate dehydrogenase subunit delta
MDIDYLVRMANDIGTFFASEPDPQVASAAILNHLKRFWDPRMRAQIIAHYDEAHSEKLEGPVLNAVKMLAAEAAKKAPA